MGTALESKDMQIHSRDPLTSSILAEVGWDGRLTSPTDQDALMVVDSNMGYNKANVFIERDIAYHVQLAEDGTAQADLTVTHTHTGEDNGEPCWQGTLDEYEEGARYQALTNKCYWNYLRVYVPEGSELLAGPQHIVPGETWFGGYDWDRPTEVLAELPGFTTFANFMLLPRATEMTSQYKYMLPDTITANEGRSRQYQLDLYKQAGITDQEVEIAVTIPPGTQLISAQPEPNVQVGETVTFNFELDSDKTISVTYE
jgi:hypothetical protein